jgi:Ala-tRNA(Pro) deacylase
MAAVTEHLEGRGIPFELVPHERAYTSIEEARALGIAADEVVKTIVLDTEGGHALVGDKHARFATEEELERDFPAYELGALAPLGSLLGTPTYVDPEVLAHETVVFPAGTQRESVKVRTEDLFREEPFTRAPLTKVAER